MEITAKNIKDLFKSEVIATYIEKVASNDIPYLGEALFPKRKIDGLKLEFVVGANGLPVALKPSSLDAKATIRDRVGFHTLETEMPFFREANQMGEKERQDFLDLLRIGNQERIQNALDTDYARSKELVDGARVQEERMRMQLLSSGKISISANNTPYEYDYTQDSDFEANNTLTLTSTDKWSDLANSDPFDDIQTAQNLLAAKGVALTRAICTSKTLGYLRNNDKIKTAINGRDGLNTALAITNKKVIQFFKDELDLTIQVYDKMFKNEAGATAQFFPDDVFTLIPEGTLGSTCMGTTPEEASKQFGADLDVSLVNGGVAIETSWDDHTIQSKTIVSEVMLPSFESMNSIYIMNV